MAAATALKGWKDGWPVEGWLAVLGFVAVAVAVVWFDGASLWARLAAPR